MLVIITKYYGFMTKSVPTLIFKNDIIELYLSINLTLVIIAKLFNILLIDILLFTGISPIITYLLYLDFINSICDTISNTSLF
ncbi:hypothetical protein AMV184 [Betaentomopoxvirus amoorei]|uniref:AMV184 n=1 Tax=Amsacta moorei entomopoxvirus TaxID=28321 RepID=Q9EML9_AMEPV|nr:hypothetical protein AMV184 [Amsacta moorei entomopoxvirus]AAG02890.1 AMV184 [Amsacta moorei entomopoxvirus]